MLKHIAQWDRSDANYSSFISLHALFFMSSTDIKNKNRKECGIQMPFFNLGRPCCLSLSVCLSPLLLSPHILSPPRHLFISLPPTGLRSVAGQTGCLCISVSPHLSSPVRLADRQGGGLARETPSERAEQLVITIAGQQDHPEHSVLCSGERGEIIPNVADLFDRTAGHCGYLYVCFCVGLTAIPPPSLL